MPTNWRVYVAFLFLFLAVAVDSISKILSAAIDLTFISLAVAAIWPLLNQKKEKGA